MRVVKSDTHELLDFVVRLALGVKVGTTLATTDGLTGQGVLEDLFETQAAGKAIYQ
jgi:hypothetical protein